MRVGAAATAGGAVIALILFRDPWATLEVSLLLFVGQAAIFWFMPPQERKRK